MTTRIQRFSSLMLLTSAAGVAAGGLIACGDGPAGTSSTSQSSSGVSSASARVTVGTAPTYATKENLVTRAPATDILSFHVHLNLHDRDIAEEEAQALNEPDDPSFGRFLTADQFHQRFAPTASDVAAVKTWLTKQGLAVDAVADDRTSLRVSGTSSAVEAAFATEIGVYQASGSLLRAPASAPTLPAEVSSYVRAVTGLHDRAHPLRSALAKSSHLAPRPAAVVTAASAATTTPSDTIYQAPPPPGSRLPPGCTNGYDRHPVPGLPAFGPIDGLQQVQCGLTPPTMRTLYEVDGVVSAGLDGRGVTVAVVDSFAASPTLVTDVQTYTARHDPKHRLASGQLRTVVSPDASGLPPQGGTADIQGWYEEQTLDVEAIHAMAPGADILYVGTNGDLDDDSAAATLDWIVDHDLATLISGSFYEPEPYIEDPHAYDDVVLQANLKGIGLYFATGDYGDNRSVDPEGVASASYPASLGGVTGVGGTSVATDARGRRLYEIPWQQDGAVLQGDAWGPPYPGFYGGGGGGGASAFAAEPSYQRNVVPPALSGTGATAHRVTPDVALVADPENVGFLVGETQTFPDGVYFDDEATTGGTSLATPTFVGILAIAEQARGSRIGFVNPALYKLKGLLTQDVTAASSPTAVTEELYADNVDAAHGTVRIASIPDEEDATTLKALPGYDSSTGLGRPESVGLVTYYALSRIFPRHW